MITMRGLVLLVPVLLVGCATACPEPGYPSPINERCTYRLRVTHVDAASNVVKATSGRSYAKSYFSSETTGYGKEGTDGEFSFRVKDIDKLVNTGQLKADKVYIFTSSSGSAYLELYTSDADKKATQELIEKQHIEKK